MKICDELQADLIAALPLVTQSVSASLVQSEAVSESVQAKCWRTLRKKLDERNATMSAEHKTRLQKLHKELELKNKVQWQHSTARDSMSSIEHTKRDQHMQFSGLAFAAGFLPRTQLGELTMLPQTLELD